MANSGYNYANGAAQQHQQNHTPQTPWYGENGRFYGTFHPGQYLLPVDENELDRMDIMHKFMTVARRQDAIHGLHEVSIPQGPAILDLGCGTGIWAIDMADQYQFGKVIGLDLNFSQPERHLKPSTGVIEHVEIDFTPLSGDNSLPYDSRLRFWFNELRLAHQQAGRPIVLDPTPETLLRQAGFEDIKRNIKEIPYHPWPSSEHQRDVGRWFNLGMVHGLEAMSLAPLTRHRGYSKEQVDALLQDVKREICTRTFRSHCTM
ncbi:hypothetical protein LQW54_005967 [Pestalotiopsis sp. IQ-011]